MVSFPALYLRVRLTTDNCFSRRDLEEIEYTYKGEFFKCYLHARVNLNNNLKFNFSRDPSET